VLLSSAIGFLVAVVVVLCIAGLHTIATVNMLPVSALGTVYAVHTVFVGVCGAIGQLLK
jgi:hypothetical protein